MDKKNSNKKNEDNWSNKKIKWNKIFENEIETKNKSRKGLKKELINRMMTKLDKKN